MRGYTALIRRWICRWCQTNNPDSNARCWHCNKRP